MIRLKYITTLLLLSVGFASAQDIVITVAGDGTQAQGPDGVLATDTQLISAGEVILDNADNLFISADVRIRRVDAVTGIITTVVGTGTPGFAGDGGPATAAQINLASDLAFDSAGNLFIAEANNNRIRRVDAATGIITTVAGSGATGLGNGGFSGDGGPATAAQLDAPFGVSVDGAGNLFIADRDNQRIRRVDVATGIITTVAGSGPTGIGNGGFGGDGGPATDALLSFPYDVSVDSAGNLFIADNLNRRIRRVDAATGIITTVVGTGGGGSSGDGGPATAAQMVGPISVEVDSRGNLFITDTFGDRIRKVDTTGIITTIAGNGIRGFAGDGGPATDAQLNLPHGVAVDSTGDVYIGDLFNFRVRKVTSLSPQTITFGPLEDQPISTEDFTVSATASSGLPVTFSSDDLTICTVDATTGAVTFVSVGTCTIIANQAGNTTFAPASPVEQSFEVIKGTQEITFEPLEDTPISDAQVFLMATASSDLPVEFSSATPDVCTVDIEIDTGASIASLLAIGTCTVNADQAGDDNFEPAPQVQQSFEATVAVQEITFGALEDKTVLDPDFMVSATASSGLPVSFSSDTPDICTIDRDTVSLVAIGLCTINADQAGDAIFEPAPQVQQSFNVTVVPQTITFDAIEDQIVTNDEITISATASSGLPVAFSSATPDTCTVDGDVVSLLAVGLCTINANQAGNDTFAPAPQVQQSFSELIAPQIITFDNLDDKTIIDPDFAISAVASSDLPVSFSSATPDVCAVDGDTVSLVAIGTCTINADQAGDATFAPAPQVQQSFNVIKSTQTINFNVLANQPLNQSNIALSATASSGLPVSFSSATPDVCTVVGSTVNALAIGMCTINADQAGDDRFEPALQVQQSFDITLAAQTITFDALEDKTVFDTNFGITATASSGLFVSFSSDTPDVCTVGNGIVRLSAAGVCTIAANQAGNVVFAAAPQVQQSFNVTRAAQTITFEPLADRALLEADVVVTATASSDLAVGFSSATPDVCTTTDDTVSLVAVGVCIINADQTGDDRFEPAPQVQQRFNITAASQTINFDSLTNRLISSPDVTLSATASSGLGVSFSSATPNICTVVDDTVSLVEIGTCTINANQAGNAIFAAAPQVQQSFTVSAPANVVQVLPGVDFGEVDAARGQTNVSLLSLQLVLSEGSVGVTLDRVALASSIFAGINRAESLRLYIDDGTRGIVDPQDMLLATLSGNDVGQLVFNFPERTLQPGLPVWVLVVGDF